MNKRDEHVSAMLVQKHQLDQSESKIGELDAALNALQQSQESNNNALDQALADLDSMLGAQGIDTTTAAEVDEFQELQVLSQASEAGPTQSKIA